MTTEANPDLSWAHLDKMRVGRFGEYYARMAFVRAGYDVFTPEVDDRSIDAIIRVPGDPPAYYDLQIKTARIQKPTYVFAKKRLFPLAANRLMAVVLLTEGRAPDVLVIPASAWLEPKPPFTAPEYLDKKSEPEFGLRISSATLADLARYRFAGRIPPQ
jgi:hypothetical protein